MQKRGAKHFSRADTILIIVLVLSVIAVFSLMKIPPSGSLAAEGMEPEHTFFASPHKTTEINLRKVFPEGSYLLSLEDKRITGKASISGDFLNIENPVKGKYYAKILQTSEGKTSEHLVLIEVEDSRTDLEIIAANTNTEISDKVEPLLDIRGDSELVIRFESDAAGNKDSQKKQKEDIKNSQAKVQEILQEGKLKTADVKEAYELQTYESLPYAKLKVSKNELKDLLQKHPYIAEVVPNERWGISLNTSISIIGASTAHNLTFNKKNITGSGVGVCVLDTGISSHSSLPSPVASACFCSVSDNGNGGCCPNAKAYDSNVDDDNGHGTHVAGIVGARGSITGVAPNSSMVIVKICDAAGECSLADFLSGMEYCISNRENFSISVISGSLGDGGAYGEADCPTYADSTIETADAAGIASLFAAGNQGQNGVNYPSCSPKAISVGATKKDGNLAEFSNYGSRIDILAPGDSIVSTAQGDSTAERSGTSMATPHISGSAALMYQIAGLMNVTMNKSIIIDTFQRTGVSVSGEKRVDIGAAAAVYISNYTINVSRNSIHDNASGKIQFNTDVNEAKMIGCIEFDQNFTKVNANNPKCAEFNTSAIVSIYNITAWNVSILKNGEKCSSCSNLSYDNLTGIATFDVVEFGSYSAKFRSNVENVTASNNTSLAVAKTASSASVTGREVYNYTINITNSGPGNATDVVVVENFNESLTLISSSPTNTTQNSWYLGNFSEGRQKQIKIQVNISNGNGIVENTINVTFRNDSGETASISAAGQNVSLQEFVAPNSSLNKGASYSFDEPNGSIAIDSINSANNLDITNAERAESSSLCEAGKKCCVSGNCLRFRGNSSYVSANVHPVQNPANLTVEAWIFTNSTNNSEDKFILWESSFSGFNLRLEENNSIRWQVMLNSSGETSGISRPIQEKEWYHLTGVYSKEGNLLLYIDGKLEFNKTIPSEQLSSGFGGNDFSIGARNLLNSDKDGIWDGIIDETKVYARLLSSDEISNNFQLGATKLAGMKEGFQIFDNSIVIQDNGFSTQSGSGSSDASCVIQNITSDLSALKEVDYSNLSIFVNTTTSLVQVVNYSSPTANTKTLCVPIVHNSSRVCVRDNASVTIGTSSISSGCSDNDEILFTQCGSSGETIEFRGRNVTCRAEEGHYTITNLENTEATESPQASVNVTLNKTDILDPVISGALLNYTITINVTNAAEEENLTNVTIIEVDDPRTTFVSSIPTPNISNTQNQTWYFGNANGTTRFEINKTVRVFSNLTNLTNITNNVTLIFNTTSGNFTSFEVSENTTAIRQAGNLSCLVSASTACPASYTEVLFMSNITNAHAELVNVSSRMFNSTVCCTDTTNKNTVLNSSGTTFLMLSNFTNAHVERPTTDYSFPALINGTFDDVQCVYENVTGQCTGGRACVATISNFTNAHISDCTTVNPSPTPYNLTICCEFVIRELILFNGTTISVSKFTIPSSGINPGDTFNYTINVTNTGPGNATDLTIFEQFNESLTLISSNPQNTTQNSWYLGNFSVGEFRQINATVQLSAGFQEGIIENIINISFINGTNDAQESRVAGTNVTIIEFNGTNLSIIKFSGPSIVKPGEVFNYTINISNQGPGNATDVTVFEQFSSNLTFISSNPPNTTQNSWYLGNFSINESRQINITVQVANDFNGTIENIINTTFTNNTGDSVFNQTAGTNVTVILYNGTNLSIEKTSEETSVFNGTTFNYTINITNLGPGNATDVTVFEQFSSNLTFISSNPPNTTENNWYLGNFSVNEFRQINITVRTNETITDAVIENIINVTFTNSTGDSIFNQTAGQNVTIQSNNITNLSIVKFPSLTLIKSGETFNYTINVTNSGPGNTTDVTIFEQFNENITFISSNPPNTTQNSWYLGNFSAGESMQINITVTVNENFSGILENMINASFVNGTDDGNNETVASTNTSVNFPNSTNVSVVKVPSQTLLRNGEIFNYTINITNLGPGNATDFMIIEQFPVNLTFISSKPRNTTENSWYLGNFSVNESKQLNISVITNESSNGTIENIINFTFTNSTGDSISNDTAGTNITVNPDNGTNFSIVKIVNSTGVLNGSFYNYTINITNLGPGNATDVTIFEQFNDSRIRFNDSNPQNTSINDWYLGNFSANESRQINITVHVNESYFGAIENIINFTFVNDTGDSVEGEIPGTNVTSANSSDISIAKKIVASTASPGETYNYTINISNLGPLEVVDITVFEQFNDRLITFVSSKPVNTSINDFYLGNLSSGEFVQLNITVTVNSSIDSTTIVENIINITYDSAGARFAQEAGTNVTVEIPEAAPPPSVEEPSPPLTGGAPPAPPTVEVPKVYAPPPVGPDSGCNITDLWELNPLDDAIAFDPGLPPDYEQVRAFSMNCGYKNVELVVSVPETYTDFRLYRCAGGDCYREDLTENENLICNESSLLEMVKANMMPKMELEPIEFEYTISEVTKPKEFAFVQKGMDLRFESGGTTFSVSTPSTAVPQPANPTLGIVGAPLIIEFRGIMPSPSIFSVKIPLREISSFEEGSFRLYAYSGGLWKQIDGIIEDGMLKASFDPAPFTEYGRIMLGVLGIRCANCKDTAFEKLYDGGSGHAVIFVHGLGSSPETFEFLKEEFRLTKQPWQVWTFGYPSTMKLDEIVQALADSLEFNTNRFETVTIVSHSLGGIISQEALRNLEMRREYGETVLTLEKRPTLVLVASPNEGSPLTQFYTYFYTHFMNQDITGRLFGVNSKLIDEINNGRIVSRVPGVRYYVIAGARTYDFSVGPFLFRPESFFGIPLMKNDGVVTVKSAQRVGKGYIKDSCIDYFELDLTHTQLVDHPTARRVIAYLIAKDKELQTKSTLLGRNSYLNSKIDSCSESDVFLLYARKIPEEEARGILDCNCGNGVCGIGETLENCPADCAVIEEDGTLLRKALIGILSSLILILVGFVLFIRRKEEKEGEAERGTQLVKKLNKPDELAVQKIPAVKPAKKQDIPAGQLPTLAEKKPEKKKQEIMLQKRRKEEESIRRYLKRAFEPYWKKKRRFNNR